MSLRRLALRMHVCLLVALIPLLDRFMTFRRMLSLLTPPAGFTPYRSVAASDVTELVHRRLRNPRNMRRRACLRKGLALFHFLGLAGESPVLHVGVYPPQEGRRRLTGHCWVTCDGEVVSDPPYGPCAEVLTYTNAVVDSRDRTAAG
jgi:hypothetical protein